MVAGKLVERAGTGIVATAIDLPAAMAHLEDVAMEPATRNEISRALFVCEELLDCPVDVQQQVRGVGEKVRVASRGLEEEAEATVDADAARGVADSMTAKAVLVVVEGIAQHSAASVVEHLERADKEVPT